MAEPKCRATISVEVAYAEPERQFLRRLDIAACATVAQAIVASGVEREFPLDAGALAVGIWSKPVARDALLTDGDRVELYRLLKADPKESRRQRANRASGKRARADQP
jgi:putative ubiquitin-RnfH superfamily antitoxin RatB of RatAB toxin-antitoxin module